jgi:two-component system OmpR family sensor kinase
MKSRALAPLLVGSPALVGLALWLAFRAGWLPDSIVYLRANLAILPLALGLLLTILCGAGWTVFSALTRRSRKQLAEARAEEAARHRQFLRRLDHELKNPLTAMQIEVANLEPDIGPEGDRPLAGPSFTAPNPQTVQRLKGQVTRMNDLVIQLRKLGELETHPIEHEPVRLDELLLDLVQEFRASEGGAQREITLNLPQIPWPLPEVEGDADLVYLALRNVLGNAVKFSRPGDPIQVRAFEDAAQVTVEIADRGPGIPQEELPHVWEELYRGKLARGLPGSGLGLAIVKAIVERHGGQVALRSRLNQGTVVTVRLPTRLSRS